MTDLRQAAQQALEALESGLAFDTHSDVLQNLRTALAMHQVSDFAQAQEQQAEPVADEAIHAAWAAGFVEGEKAALEQQQAEPVAWDKPSASFNDWWDSYRHDPANPFAEGSAAYWAWAGWKSAQRQWVGLTDDEILEAAGIDGADTWVFETAYAIEAKLKERNT